MRFASDDENHGAPAQLAGSLLLAHPSLQDANFRRSVILLTAHSDEAGSLGVIVNRPLDKTLGEYGAPLEDSKLAAVPLYEGGPVGGDQMILVAWKWDPAGGTFQLLFGIDEAKAVEVLESGEGFELRGFVGHSGWSDGQLEAELEAGAWVPAPLAPEIGDSEGESSWRVLLSRVSPELRVLAEEPDDPTRN